MHIQCIKLTRCSPLPAKQGQYVCLSSHQTGRLDSSLLWNHRLPLFHHRDRPPPGKHSQGGYQDTSHHSSNQRCIYMNMYMYMQMHMYMYVGDCDADVHMCICMYMCVHQSIITCTCSSIHAYFSGEIQRRYLHEPATMYMCTHTIHYMYTFNVMGHVDM